MKYVIDQQNTFNGNTFEAIYGIAEKNIALESQNIELKDRLDLLEKEVNALRVEIQNIRK